MAEHLDGCANPSEMHGARKLEGTERGWRYRLGSYRLLVSICDEELVVEVVPVEVKAETNLKAKSLSSFAKK